VPLTQAWLFAFRMPLRLPVLSDLGGRLLLLLLLELVLDAGLLPLAVLVELVLDCRHSLLLPFVFVELALGERHLLSLLPLEFFFGGGPFMLLLLLLTVEVVVGGSLLLLLLLPVELMLV
jgi:hypothetical protein